MADDGDIEAVAEHAYARLRAWLDRVEDLSGLPDGVWLDQEALGDQLDGGNITVRRQRADDRKPHQT